MYVLAASRKARPIRKQWRRTMNKEYLSAKAELCSKLAVEQINNGNEEEGVKNLKRMVRALNDIHLINIEEGRGRK
jgi:hypothetical protein